MSYFERPSVNSLIYTAPALEVNHVFLVRSGKQLPGSHVITERLGFTPVVFALEDKRAAGRDYAEPFIRE